MSREDFTSMLRGILGWDSETLKPETTMSKDRQPLARQWTAAEIGSIADAAVADAIRPFRIKVDEQFRSIQNLKDLRKIELADFATYREAVAAETQETAVLVSLLARHVEGLEKAALDGTDEDTDE